MTPLPSYHSLMTNYPAGQFFLQATSNTTYVVRFEPVRFPNLTAAVAHMAGTLARLNRALAVIPLADLEVPHAASQ